ncbi:MAG: hypothetical protein R3B47_01725 [Bacteroidia bacterium]
MELSANAMTIEAGPASMNMAFKGASTDAKMSASEKEARFENLYPGTSLRLYDKGDGNAGYDFELEAGAEPSTICMELEEGANAWLNRDGELVIREANEEVRHTAPMSYQVIDGKRFEVESRFTLADGCVAFELGDYDPAYGLTIDPKVYRAYRSTAASTDFRNPIGGGGSQSWDPFSTSTTQSFTNYLGSGSDVTFRYSGNMQGAACYTDVTGVGTPNIYNDTCNTATGYEATCISDYEGSLRFTNNTAGTTVADRAWVEMEFTNGDAFINDLTIGSLSQFLRANGTTRSYEWVFVEAFDASGNHVTASTATALRANAVHR